MTYNGSDRGRPHPTRAVAGMDVLDRDGVLLGTVTETFGGVFRLTTPDGAAYWLGYDLVVELAGSTVVLRITCADLSHEGSGDVRSTPYVLIVDDDPLIRSVLIEALHSSGVRALTANDGEDALRLVERETPALVLVDLRMPGLDGPGFASALKERDINVPIVLMSAFGEVSQQAQRLGAAAYIPQPFDLRAISEMIRGFVRAA